MSKVPTLVTTYVEQLGANKFELAGDGAQAHDAKITELAAAAFPSYALPYLVYGLAQHIASR